MRPSGSKRLKVIPTPAERPSSLELSIIMPCLNEAATVGECIDKAKRFLAEHGVRGEVIVADNGSTDGSQEIVIRRGGRLVRVRDKGYGSALLGGIRAARGTYVVMGDSDASYDFSSILPFLEKLRGGFDLVMGNRFLGGIKPGAMPALHRYLGNPVLTALGRLFFSTPSSDFHCGLRGFRKDAALKLDLRCSGMEFASELVAKASLHRMKVTEVPTILYKDGRDGPSHLRSWRDGWRHLRFLLLYSPNWLFLGPGASLFLSGLVTSLWLASGPRQVRGLVFDVHTLIYAGTAMILGVQLMLFWLFSNTFAVSQGLRPSSKWTRAIARTFTLEKGLLLGASLLLVGLLGSVRALIYWRLRQFGALDTVTGLRLVVPCAVCLTLGGQILFSSFFLSLLALTGNRSKL